MMDYSMIDPAERERALILATGDGDLSLLTAKDADTAERSAVVLQLRAEFLDAHGSSDDPEAAAFARAAAAIADPAKAARAVANRVAKATKADTSAVRPEIVAANLQKAEADHFDAEWKLANVTVSPDEKAALEAVRDRAAREITVLRKAT